MYATKEQREEIYWKMKKTIKKFPWMRDMKWCIVSGFEDKGFIDRKNIYVSTRVSSTLSNVPWRVARFWEDLEEIR